MTIILQKLILHGNERLNNLANALVFRLFQFINDLIPQQYNKPHGRFEYFSGSVLGNIGAQLSSSARKVTLEKSAR